jgi:hypothetical protein
MKIDQIIQSWKEDTKIDDLNLDIESTRIPNLHSKYLSFLSDERIRLRGFQSQRRTLVGKLKTFYSGSATQEDLEFLNKEQFLGKTLKNEIMFNIETDELVIDIDAKISAQEVKVMALEEIVKSINNRGYQIKNAIDWRRLTVGGM